MSKIRDKLANMGNSFACQSGKPLRKLHGIRWNDKLDKPVPSGETLLTIAVDADLVDLLLQLLKEGASVNQQNVNGNTPLHVAIRSRNEPILDILIDSGANVNARDRCGLTPLHLACIIQNKWIIERLLDAGAKPDGIQDDKFYVSTPLMTATENKDLDAAMSLISSGANVNAKDWWQNTALLKAVQIGSQELVELLLQHKADPNVTNRFGGSALHYAVVADQCDIMRVLIESGCVINSCGSQARESTVNYSPLAAAIHRNCLRCFCYLIASGAQIDGQDLQQKTPLVYALTNRAWDCQQRGHDRHIPTCMHTTGPPFVDSERLVFAEKLLVLGASVYFAWDRVVWQIRHHFLRSDDRDGLLLCIRAAGFLSIRDFKVETFYRVLALSGQWQPLWYLIQAGYNPTEEERSLATSARRFERNSSIRQDSLEHQYDPVVWLADCLKGPRSLRNLAVLRIRRSLQKNVLYGASKLIDQPKPLKALITLDHEEYVHLD